MDTRTDVIVELLRVKTKKVCSGGGKEMDSRARRLERQERLPKWRKRTGSSVWAGMFALAAMAMATAEGQLFTLEMVAGGLDRPTFVTHVPGDNSSIFITELDGAVKKVDLETGTITTFATLDATTANFGGLHSIAFHPDFQNNGKFYAAHVVDAYGSFTSPVSRVDEYAVDGSGTVSLTRNFLEAEHNSPTNGSHSIDWIGFDPTNSASETLYATIGDGYTVATQPETSPYTKVLTFEVSDASPTWQMLHTGLRNPWRASFDRETGDMYIGDVGQSAREEINFARAGASGIDFGWARREGTRTGLEGGLQGGTFNPVFEFGHPVISFSVTGGYVYRGPVSELQGKYFFADFMTHQIWSSEFDRDTFPGFYCGDNLTGVTERKAEFDALIPGGGDLNFIVSFGEDNVGNLYLVDYGDGVLPTAGTGEVFVIKSVPGADPDGDGQDDYFEFVAGTNPNDAASRFKVSVEPVPGTTDQVEVCFSPRLPGRNYKVQKSADAGATDPWVDLAGGIESDNGSKRTVTDSNAIEACKYYRIRIDKL